jgi:hypothetical protein
MNSFDAVFYLALIFAVVTGFNTGLLRSAIKILGYLIAAPIAMTATSLLAPQVGGKFGPAIGPGAEFDPVLRDIPDIRHAARTSGASAGGRRHRIAPQSRRPCRRHDAWRGACRPDCDHAGAVL